MRKTLMMSAALLGLAVGAPAFAQTAMQGMNPATGARPGHVPGVGQSYPLGNNASNINANDTRSEIAPTLPSPPVGPDAKANAYLRAALRSMNAGRTGEAQQSMEMAETRLLTRSVNPAMANTPDTNARVQDIAQARQALGNRDYARVNQLLQQAMAPGNAAQQMGGGMGQPGYRQPMGQPGYRQPMAQPGYQQPAGQPGYQQPMSPPAQ